MQRADAHRAIGGDPEAVASGDGRGSRKRDARVQIPKRVRGQGGGQANKKLGILLKDEGPSGSPASPDLPSLNCLFVADDRNY